MNPLNTMDALLIKYWAISLLDTIEASTVLATLGGLLDLGMKLILAGFKSI